MLIQVSPRLRRRKNKERAREGELGNWERELGRAGASGSEQGRAGDEMERVGAG
jgi:hypothetical protein